MYLYHKWLQDLESACDYHAAKLHVRELLIIRFFILPPSGLADKYRCTLTIGHIRIPGIRLELVCKRG